jgi:hypothetical protein
MTICSPFTVPGLRTTVPLRVQANEVRSDKGNSCEARALANVPFDILDQEVGRVLLTAAFIPRESKESGLGFGEVSPRRKKHYHEYSCFGGSAAGEPETNDENQAPISMSDWGFCFLKSNMPVLYKLGVAIQRL